MVLTYFIKRALCFLIILVFQNLILIAFNGVCSFAQTKELIVESISDAMMEVYAKGKRSIVYKDGNVIIKIEREDIQAVERIANEAKWLKRLNKEGIGPKFIKRVGNKVYMEFVDGEKIMDYSKKASKRELKKVLLDLLEQCRTMDKLKVSKFEMHHPLKHVIVSKNKPVLIDFERCKLTERPKNVTQVAQFYARYFGIEGILEKAKAYKETYSDAKFKDVKECVINTL
tara:strand:+ start:5061 stop:5747 length:687 start_codon:yes stop_codon:yes gene_type:complete